MTDKKPVIDGANIAPTAIVIGDVVLEKDCSVWFGAVIRGDTGTIHIGEGTNIQDNAVIHDETEIGCFCTVGHSAIVHGAKISDHCLIGMGSIVLNGAKLGEGCMVAAGAVVTGKTDAPPYSLLMGNPAKIVKPLSPAQIEANIRSTKFYVEEGKAYFGK